MADMPAPRKRPVVSTVVGIARHNMMPHDPFKVSVTFTYRQADPYAVAMDICAIDEDAFGVVHASSSQRWEFARSLLADALTGRYMPTLIGDVRVSVLDSCTAQIRLIDPESCPDHPATFDMHLDLEAVRRFLRRSFEDVPAGEETSFTDVESVLVRLFGDNRHRSSGA
jgi:hypothetical protein